MFEKTILPAINAARRITQPYQLPADESDPDAFWIDDKAVKLAEGAPAEAELHEGLLKAAGWISRSNLSQDRMIDIATGFCLYGCFHESWIESQSKKSTGDLIKRAKVRSEANKSIAQKDRVWNDERHLPIALEAYAEAIEKGFKPTPAYSHVAAKIKQRTKTILSTDTCGRHIRKALKLASSDGPGA
jgi:hypothetical protein